MAWPQVADYNLRLQSHTTISDYSPRLQSHTTISDYSPILQSQITVPDYSLRLRFLTVTSDFHPRRMIPLRTQAEFQFPIEQCEEVYDQPRVQIYFQYSQSGSPNPWEKSLLFHWLLKNIIDTLGFNGRLKVELENPVILTSPPLQLSSLW